MSRTVNNNWLEALEHASFEPVVLVTIQLTAGTSRKFVSGDLPRFGAEPSIASIAPRFSVC